MGDRILMALDLGENCGVAWGAAIQNCVPNAERWHLNSKDVGRRFSMLRRFLVAAIREKEITDIAYEKPMFQGFRGAKGQRSFVVDETRSFPLIGYAAIVRGVAAEFNLNCTDLGRSTIYSRFLGKGQGFAEKRAVRLHCDMLRWDCHGDDNQADALALWAVVAAQIRPLLFARIQA